MFANIVAELASQFKNASDFVQALRNKFTQDKDRLNWGSEGFRTPAQWTVVLKPRQAP